MMALKEILSKCDHTLLAQTAAWDEIRAIKAACKEKLLKVILRDAEDFIRLGASRLGTSRIVKAVKAMED